MKDRNKLIALSQCFSWKLLSGVPAKIAIAKLKGFSSQQLQYNLSLHLDLPNHLNYHFGITVIGSARIKQQEPLNTEVYKVQQQQRCLLLTYLKIPVLIEKAVS